MVLPVENLLNFTPVEGSSTDSDASFACAKEWLRVCASSHDLCRPVQQDGCYRPTRLLRISESGTEVHLCEGDEIPATITYATLSHSWGSVLPLTLTGERMPSFKRGIPVTDLPKTFQEAVQVARHFDVWYLWIDCLCIIQDSAEDWKKESVLMASIYGNSHLNIAATASRDGRGGCFRSRRPTALTPAKMTLHGKDFYLVDAEMWWESFEKAPLNTRAWVLQERPLSPRVLHFDHDQLVWECNELIASERYPAGISGGLIPAPRFLRNRLDSLVQGTSVTPGQELFHVWKPIVRAYSSCGLTKSSDKLIALHGIGSRIKDILKANYSAGLFSANLESQLLWKVADNETSARPEQHVAPSWSWASIIGPISILPQWDFVDTRGEEFTRQFKGEQLRERILCRVRNKHLFGAPPSRDDDDDDYLDDATTTTGNISNNKINNNLMTSHEKLEIECYLIPIYYPSLADTSEWKKIKYEPYCAYDQDPSTVPTEIWPMEIRNYRSSVYTGTTEGVSVFKGGLEYPVLITTKPVRGDPEEAESNKINMKFEYDLASEAASNEQRFLLPVYSVTEWRGLDVFDLVPYRSMNGLVVERVRGTSESGPVFKRCGTFKLNAWSDRDAPWRFWNSALRFDALEDVLEPELCDDAVVPIISEKEPPEGASDDERSIKYEKRDGVRQYVVTIV